MSYIMPFCISLNHGAGGSFSCSHVKYSLFHQMFVTHVLSVGQMLISISFCLSHIWCDVVTTAQWGMFQLSALLHILNVNLTVQLLRLLDHTPVLLFLWLSVDVLLDMILIGQTDLG